MHITNFLISALRRNAEFIGNILERHRQRRNLKNRAAEERRPSSRMTRYKRVHVRDGLIEEVTEHGPRQISTTKKLWLWMQR